MWLIRNEGSGQHLAKVPGLAIDADAATIHTVLVKGERAESSLDLLHGRHHQVAHDVKAEAIHLFAFAQPSFTICTFEYPCTAASQDYKHGT